MRKILLLPVLMLFALSGFGQETGDTTVYTFVDEMPRFPGCEPLDTTDAVKYLCSQDFMLAFIYQNVQYPFEARQNGNEGTVVVSFIVEPDSLISDVKVAKDIGGGCGEETLRVVGAMNDVGVRWTPGKKKGKAVRVRMNVPVRFKLEEAPDFAVIDGDSIWTNYDEPLSFKGGDEGLSNYMEEKLVYPENWKDSCLIGQLDAKLIVNRKGEAKVLDIVDYNELGFDFWYAATSAITGTYGQWNVAKLDGKKVPTAYELSVTFKSPEAHCKGVEDNYLKAAQLMNDGATLYNDGQQDAGIAKMNEAIVLVPNDANFLMVRGQAFMDMKKFAEACSDLRRVKEISSVDWYDSILPLICQ